MFSVWQYVLSDQGMACPTYCAHIQSELECHAALKYIGGDLNVDSGTGTSVNDQSLVNGCSMNTVSNTITWNQSTEEITDPDYISVCKCAQSDFYFFFQ